MADEFTIDLTPIEKFAEKFAKDFEKAREKLAPFVLLAGEAIRTGIVERTPVDTGALRRSFFFSADAKRDEILLTIASPLNYALPVEKGHVTRSGSRVAGRFMVEEGIKAKTREAVRIMSRGLRKIFT